MWGQEDRTESPLGDTPAPASGGSHLAMAELGHRREQKGHI